jgi:hypothetical protein
VGVEEGQDRAVGVGEAPGEPRRFLDHAAHLGVRRLRGEVAGADGAEAVDQR